MLMGFAPVASAIVSIVSSFVFATHAVIDSGNLVEARPFVSSVVSSFPRKPRRGGSSTLASEVAR
jgi:hypothetical protein